MNPSLDSTSIEHARHKLWLSLNDRLLDTPDEYAALTADERFYFFACWFHCAVEHGGFEQYFFHSAGDHHQEVLTALKHIGAKKSASLLKKATLAFFGRQFPPVDNFDRVDAIYFHYRGPTWEPRMKTVEDAFSSDPDRFEERLAQFALEKGLLTPFLP
jgi:hypothetical protein